MSLTVQHEIETNTPLICSIDLSHALSQTDYRNLNTHIELIDVVAWITPQQWTLCEFLGPQVYIVKSCRDSWISPRDRNKEPSIVMCNSHRNVVVRNVGCILGLNSIGVECKIGR